MLSSLTWICLALVAGHAAAENTGSIELNPGNYFLNWTCFPNNGTIEFRIRVRAQGWVGFGLSPDGFMPMSDVVIYFSDGSFQDRHTVGKSTPILDTQQDWFFVAGSNDGVFREAKFVRLLTSLDTNTMAGVRNDRDIPIDAPVNLIYAWRDAAEVDFIRHDVRGMLTGVTLCTTPPVDPTPTATTPTIATPPTSTATEPEPSASPEPSPSPSPTPTDPDCTGVTCINKEVLDPRDCSCSCPFTSYPCPFNQMFNTANCACEDLGPCPEVTNTTCPDGQVFSRLSCDCVSECNRNCTDYQRLDENLCECVCPPGFLDPSAKCPSPLTFNPSTCKCECGLTCPAPSALDTDNCVCTCGNVSTSCPAGQSFDPSMCMCRCDKEEECCEGRVFNTDACECQCADMSDCPSGESRNPNTCQCECAAKSSEDLWYQEFGKCWRDNYKVFSIFSCGCECPKFLTCPQGKVISPSTCRCGCPPRPASCPQYKHYHPNSCQCYCPTRLHCGYGKLFNEDTCRCECKVQNCPAGKRFDHNSCSCVCATSPSSCPAGKTWDSSQCGCVCAQRSCGSNQYFDSNTCQCRCRQHLYCQSGKQWDSSKCACVCPPQHCPSSKRWDSSSCSCRCSGSSYCSSGWAYNPSSCSCQCSKRCEHYQTLDRHSCQCKNSYYPSTHAPTTRPPTTRPPVTQPPSGCSRYQHQQTCRTSGYHGLSCRFHRLYMIMLPPPLSLPRLQVEERWLHPSLLPAHLPARQEDYQQQLAVRPAVPELQPALLHRQQLLLVDLGTWLLASHMITLYIIYTENNNRCALATLVPPIGKS